MYNSLTTNDLTTELAEDFHTRPLTLLTRRETLNLAAYARRIADRGTTLCFIHEGNVDDWEVWQTEDGHHRVFPKFAVEPSEMPSTNQTPSTTDSNASYPYTNAKNDHSKHTC